MCHARITVGELDGKVGFLGAVSEEGIGVLLFGYVTLPQQLHAQAFGVEPASIGQESTSESSLKEQHRCYIAATAAGGLT